MPRAAFGFLQSLRSRKVLDRWRAAAEAGVDLTDRDLMDLAGQARAVERYAGAVARAADRRFRTPKVGLAGIEQPAQCDWAWRADPWAAALSPSTIAGAEGGAQICEGVRLFHDCPLSEITLRQSLSTDRSIAAPFVLTMDILGFEGSFLSLAMDLPAEGAKTLSRSHIVLLTARVTMEREAEVFARLNIRQGPNTEQLVSELKPGELPDSPVSAEFDLGFHDINPAKLESAWIDLIFDKPAMNMVRIEDLTVTRRPRADI